MNDEETMPPAGASVISMESRIVKGAKPRLIVPRAEFCSHSFEIDRKTRLGTCTRCKVAWHAFEILLYVTEHWPDFHGNREAIRKDIKILQTERDELKAEVDRLKATARRRIRNVAEVTPHATKALELMLRIQRLAGSGNSFSSDRSALFSLLREIELEAKIVPIERDLTIDGSADDKVAT